MWESFPVMTYHVNSSSTRRMQTLPRPLISHNSYKILLVLIRIIIRINIKIEWFVASEKDHFSKSSIKIRLQLLVIPAKFLQFPAKVKIPLKIPGSALWSGPPPKSFIATRRHTPQPSKNCRNSSTVCWVMLKTNRYCRPRQRQETYLAMRPHAAAW